MLTLVKVGGNVIDDAPVLNEFLSAFAAAPGLCLLVHGGGKIATELGAQMGVETRMVDGRRITDDASLRLVTMVYAGLINKDLVARLQALGCNAVGLTGADGNTLPATRRQHPTIDYGWVGDVDPTPPQPDLPLLLLQQGYTPVLCALTHDRQGHLLNTNADTIANAMATRLARHLPTRVLFVFDKPGVLLDVHDDSSLIPHLMPARYAELKAQGAIFAGMLPKLDNAFGLLHSGVQQVVLCHPRHLAALLANDETAPCTRITL